MLLPQSIIRITLDVREVENQLSFAIKQNDSVRRLIVTLCDMGKPYVIGRGCYAVFSATTSANTTISNGCQIKNNEIIYDLSASDTAVVGRMDCDITLFGADGEVIAAPNFTINVYKSKMGEYASAVVPTDDFSTLQKLIGEVNERIIEIDEILESDGKTIDEAIEAGIAAIDNHTEQQAIVIEQKGAETLATIPADYTEMYNMTVKHTADIADAKSKISLNSKRLANLEAGIPEEDFVEDSGVAYIKDVPVNAMPYAQINKIGGMTYKDGDTLKSAPVTEVESVGANLCNLNDVTLSGEGYVLLEKPLFLTPGTYTFSFRAKNHTQPCLFNLAIYTDSGVKIVNIDSSVNEVSENTFTINEKSAYINLYVNSSVGGSFYNFMLNPGSTALPYRPFTKNTLAIPEAVRPKHGINENVYDYIEWLVDGTKKSHQRVGVVDMGTLTWNAEDTPTAGVRRFVAHLLGIKYAENLASKGNVLTADFPTITGADSYNGVAYGIAVSQNSANIFLSKEEYNNYSVTEFKAAMSGKILYYELIQPIITDISDILPSDNLIAVEGGGTVTFKNEHEFAVPSTVVYQVESEVNV